MTPDGWRMSSLGRHLREPIRNGYSPVCPSEPTGRWTLGLGAVTAGGFDPNGKKSAPTDDPRVLSSRLEPGDIVVSRANGSRERVGLAGIYKGEPPACSYPDLLMRVRVSAELLPEFLECQLLSRRGRRYFYEAARGTASMVKINREMLEAFPIVLPPIREQREIANVLGAVDDTIAAGEAVVEQLDRVRRDLAEDLLRHGLPGRRHRLRDTDIGKMPAAWALKALSEVGQVQTGLAKGKVAAGDTVELPYLRVANVQDGHVNLDEMKTVVVERSAVERYRLRDGDVLFTEGGDFDKLGRGCVWRGQIDPCLHQNHVFAVRTGPELHPGFLAAHAASKRGRAYFLDCAKRTTNLASINSTQLKALPVPIPPLDEQQAIVDALAAVSDRIENERAVLAERRRLKTAFADALLTGRIRVPQTDDV